MFRKFILLVTFAAMPSVASAEKITVFNNTSDSIHKLFAWPRELHPRTFNILGFPISPGSKAEVVVDNTYGDCLFMFQYDSNDPRARKKRNYRKKALGTADANICGKNVFVWLGPIPYGKQQGKP